MTLELTPEKIKEIQKRARNVARKCGYPELADDFAQELFVGLAQGWHQTTEEALIDYLRREFGSSRSLSGHARRLAKASTVSIDEPVGQGEGSAYLHDILPSPESDSNDCLRPRGPDCLFTGRDALLYELYFVDGVCEKNIGELFGVTESRVCQMIKPIKDAIQAQALWERFEAEDDFTKLEVEWIRI